jgi:aspartate kinase
VPEARKLSELSYDEMQELAHAGAKVLNAQAVEFAKQKGIVILAKSTFGAGTGTAVRDQPPPRELRVKGIACDSEMAVLTAQGTAQALPELLEFLDARGVRGRLFSFESVAEEGGCFVAVPLQDVHGLPALKRDLVERFWARVRVHEGLGTVSCVGSGISSDWSCLRRSLAAAEAIQAPVRAAHVSALQLSLLVDAAHLPGLTRRLHAEFVA